MSHFKPRILLMRFVYMLYTFGHDLDPRAPMTVEPFTPAILGMKQIANFTTYSFPLAGSALIGVFAVGVWAAMIANLLAGRREKLASQATA